MKDYIFGLKVKPVSSANRDPFAIYTQMGAGQAHNPYGNSYFNDPSYMVSAGGAKITSIPSPYARMHVTDIAFRELTAGRGVLTEDQLRNNSISDDYVRAMSHCLDMFELMYNFSDLDLKEKGITVELIDLVTRNRADHASYLAANPSLERYVETLDLYRKSYNAVIRNRVLPGNSYTFDFSQLYLFKYKDATFAATSPFTGFFTKADCDLYDAGLVSNGRPMLSANKTDWRLFTGRDPRFLEFLYLLLKDTGLFNIYANLFAALSQNVDVARLSTKTFANEFPDFNLAPQAGELPKVRTPKGDTYFRPDDIDRTYLKYVLFLEKPFNFKVSLTEFEKPIAERQSPDGQKLMPWLTVNDLLSDALFVLPYDIDDKYMAVPYEYNHIEYRRCLVPIKEEALQYLDLSDLVSNLKIKKYDDNHYCALLTLTLTTGGKIELRRDYYTRNQGMACAYPNGLVVSGNDTKSFVFGVYPFVRSSQFENIYKVMFYNSFDPAAWDIRFYYKDGVQGKLYPNDQVKRNITSTMTEGNAPINCTYYQVSGEHLKDGNDCISIVFAQLTVKVPGPVTDANGNPVDINATALIVPNLQPVKCTDNRETYVAVDLGTSNTYIAYKHITPHADSEDEILDISTVHTGFNELEFMHKSHPVKAISNPALTMFNEDAILKESDREGAALKTECLSAQLCEFIPSRIVNDDSIQGFHFPIPTVINTLHELDPEDKATNGSIPMLNRAIPFAYYTIGQRENSDGTSYDCMAEGEFKWFYGKNNNGIFATNETKKGNFNAFMSELMFIIRSNMLAHGYDLTRVTLLWTYPLSFQDTLVSAYTNAWEYNFAKLFHPECLNADGRFSADGRTRIRNFVKRTNESLSPIFYCITRPSEVHHLTVLIDIGGGSSDIVGYRNGAPEFITSFAFAGNALYLDGNLNTRPHPAPQDNYMRHFVKVASVTINSQKCVLDRTRKIDMKAPISSLMNYGFSQAPEDFANIFNNEVPKFMLELHNAALLYHTAQVIHKISPDEMPMTIYLTGNGSNLISINPSNERNAVNFLRTVLASLYGKTVAEVETKIKHVESPKRATVYGSIKGLENGYINFNTDEGQRRVVSFGDADTICAIEDGDIGIPAGRLKGKVGQVYDNVKNFIELFYQAQGNRIPKLKKEQMLKCLDNIKGDSKNNVPEDFLTDSLFFQFISLLMEDVSATFADNNFQ